MKRLVAIATTVLLAAGLAGCGSSGDTSDEGPPPPALEPPLPALPNLAPVALKTALVCPKGTHLTYQNFGQGFLRNYCQMCHSAALPAERRAGAPAGMDFDTSADASLWRAVLVAKAGADGSPQPPVNNVSSLERAQFAEWLNCGAPAE